MRIIPIVAALKMRVVIIGKEDDVAKLWTQRAQNHQLVINIRTEQTDRANSETVLSLPAHVVVFELARETPEII